MTNFSDHFSLNKPQALLDFVDIDVEKDIPLYIDPYALISRKDDWSDSCHALVYSYFVAVLDSVRAGDRNRGVELLSHLGEPTETKLGVAEEGNPGRGIGPKQARDLYDAIRSSKAARTGILEDVSDFALFIPNIGRDKVSDLTTNVIRKQLIEYTQSQCLLHGIPMYTVAGGYWWNPSEKDWETDYVELPVVNGGQILLVPKYAVRYQVAVDAKQYRTHFVLNYLQAKHQKANDSLMTVIRNKKGKITRKVVWKKTVDEHYPKDKDFLATFSEENPKIIERYRKHLRDSTSKVPNINDLSFSEANLANFLIQKLDSIPPGAKHADEYHEFIIDTLLFIFFPNLIYPKKENRINEGRKRIDITYVNGKDSGFFQRIGLSSVMMADVIIVECKNYTNEIANEEFDQLLGRFTHKHGHFGMLLFRGADEFDLAIKRCMDAANNQKKIVLPLNDDFVKSLLQIIADGRRKAIDVEVNDLYQKIIDG